MMQEGRGGGGKGCKYCNKGILRTPRQKTIALSLVSTTERVKLLAGIVAKVQGYVIKESETTRQLCKKKTRRPNA